MGCKNHKNHTPLTGTKEKAPPKTAKPTLDSYTSASDDIQMAANIKNFLIHDYLKNDLEIMMESDRKFQFYKVDLNHDNKDEYFVNFLSPYFCGTGGCTVLLLDHESNIINRFTVMETPIYIDNNQTNGWNNILVFSGKKLKELKYSNGRYPSNPSMAPNSTDDAPASSAIIMFSEKSAKAKTYTF